MSGDEIQDLAQRLSEMETKVDTIYRAFVDPPPGGEEALLVKLHRVLRAVDRVQWAGRAGAWAISGVVAVMLGAAALASAWDQLQTIMGKKP